MSRVDGRAATAPGRSLFKTPADLPMLSAMGIVEDTLLGLASDSAEDVAGERARRLVPSGTGRALALLAMLLAWIFIAGLALTGLMWIASGAFVPGIGALASGVVLAWVFTRPAMRKLH